jgi:hypothetical protein
MKKRLLILVLLSTCFISAQNCEIKKNYCKKENKKYKKFLTEITPDEFNNINGKSKYILLDNQGKVLMVTSYKDRLKGER